MKWLRLFRAFRSSNIEEELREELESHILHRADDLQRSGLTKAEAERKARIEFGGMEKYRQQSHEADRNLLFENLLQDLRVSLRALRKSPAFAVTAVLTLALAIGANTVAFSVMNGLILRPLALPDSETLYALQRGNDRYIEQSYPDYQDLRARNRSFEDLAAYNISQAALNTGSNPSSVWLYAVSGNYFDVLKVQPYLGRFFHSADEHGPNSAPFVILSYGYWLSHFHSDPQVVGSIVELNKHPFTILGVAPPAFHGTLLFFSPDLFLPLINHEQIEQWSGLNERGSRWIFEVLGHTRPGVTPAQAAADLSAIGAELKKSYPKEDDQPNFSLVRPALHGEFLAPPIRAFLSGLILLACLILMAACTNLGSLFAARAADRSRDIALRLALGSNRRRIIRQLLTEALLISLAGGGIGVAGSIVVLQYLSRWNPFPRFPMTIPATADVRVYVVALCLTLVSGLIFGAVPVRQILKTSPWEVVKAGQATASGSLRRLTIRELLLIVQISLCALLVTSSMVAIRGLIRSLHCNYGFQPKNAILAEFDLSMAGHKNEEIPSLQKELAERIASLPGVSNVGMVGPFHPLTLGGITSPVFRDTTTDLRETNAVDSAFLYKVSPNYFQAAGTVLLAGRDLSWHDDKKEPAVAVINKQMALKLFGSVQDALGKRYKTQSGNLIRVVGVVEDGKYFTLAEKPSSAAFLPLQQAQTNDVWMVVRSNRDPHELSLAVRTGLQSIDPGLPLYISPWTKELDGALFPSRMATLALGILGCMGAMLSITGIFGMAAYTVSRRIRELGIRIALGARPQAVLRAALGSAFRLLALGSAAGLALGLLAARALAVLVYQASPRDPLVLCGVVLIMLTLGLVATCIPAHRALTLDPLVLLREE